MSSPPLVLLQTSDWHVGSPLTGRALPLSDDLRAARRAEVDAVPERAVAAALSAGADALVLPGDLWDSESAPPAALHRLLEALASFSPRPVFIAPGNHDFAGPGGFYDPALLEALGMRSWPENVHVFDDPGWTAAPFPGRDDAVVVGRAFLSPAVEEASPLATPPSRPTAAISVLLLHGSLESYPGPDAPRGAKRTAPFTREELGAAGFSWVALGHHHHRLVVEDGSGAPLGAYSGCPTGRGVDEAGPRFFLRVALSPGCPPVLSWIPSDTRCIRDLTLDAAGLPATALAEKALGLLAAEGAGAGDLVRLTLTGRQPLGARPAAALEGLRGLVAHLGLRDRTSPASDVDPGPHTAEGRFVADLNGRILAATDERARRVAEVALTIGRDALAGRPVLPPRTEDL